MSWRVLLVAVAVALSTAGCAPGIDSEQARATKALDDKFLPYNEISGAVVRQSFGLLSGGSQTMRLLARRDRKSGALTTHAHVNIGYQSVRRVRFESVRSPTTELLPMRELNHDYIPCKSDYGCPHSEELMIDIPEQALRAAQQGGYAFRVYTRDGRFTTFIVPPQLIVALLNAADASGGAPTQTASAKR